MVFPALTMSIPSPPVSVWHIGPFPVRAYALAIICGIILAWFILSRRYRAKGGDADVCIDIAVWAVVFGIIGARLYHVATDWQLYFGQGRNPVDAFKIWNGGLGIWGTNNFMGNRWGNSGNSVRLNFFGLQNHCRW